MKIAIGSDERTELTDQVLDFLKSEDHQLELFGHLAHESEKWHWADIGKNVAKRVAENEADLGILFCWSGTGVCIAANKIKGARAALCWNQDIAQLARKWDDANIICMSLKETSPEEAIKMLQAWFNTEFDEEGLNQAHTVDS
jgi:ribose 5-phosphate isomerase B